MATPWLPFALCAVAFLLGSIPFGFLAARLLGGVDIREAGSGNIGATNVARTLGKGPAIGVLVLDAAKGALPVFLAQRLLPAELWLHALVAVCAVLGHVFPPWLRFRGGKGVATALGVLAVLSWPAALAGAAAYALMLGVTRIGSASSLTGCVAALITAVLLEPMPYAVLTGALVATVFWRHRDNLRRLLTGQEHKFGKRPSGP